MKLEEIYGYKNQYVPNVAELLDKIYTKTVKPHQIEVQPGPKGRSLCWLKCPYCYGGSSKVTSEKLDHNRYIEILNQIADRDVNKFIFAGYATDPLNYKSIEDLVEVPKSKGLIAGFHTKAIRVSDRLISQLTSNCLDKRSYFSVSVDAGKNETYNKVHGMPEYGAKFYDRVKNNLKKLSQIRTKNKTKLTISATYLINSLNEDFEEIRSFIKDFKGIGVDLIRFSFPQVPRGYVQEALNDKNIPNADEKAKISESIFDFIQSESSEKCKILALDYDKEMGIENVSQTLPCFARWVFPSIGYDGYLGHCSESAAPHFRKMSLGNLNKYDFWDLYYDYNPEQLFKEVNAAGKIMRELDCKCDRKEHAVNTVVRGGFNKKYR